MLVLSDINNARLENVISSEVLDRKNLITCHLWKWSKTIHKKMLASEICFKIHVLVVP